MLDRLKNLLRATSSSSEDNGILSTVARPVKVGIIGAGKAGKYHAEALASIGNVALDFIANTGASRAEDLQAAFSIPQWYDDSLRALDETQPDAVVIAVPPEHAIEIATAWLQKGVPCLVEKPVALTSVEASHLSDISSSLGVYCAVGLNRRHYASVRYARAICEQVIPYAIHIEAPENIAAQRGKGKPQDIIDQWLMLNGIHSIDLMTCFGGAVARVHTAAPIPVLMQSSSPESFSAIVAFEKGMCGTFISHWASPGPFMITLYFPGARLEIDVRKNDINVQGDLPFVQAEFDAMRSQDKKFKAGVYHQDVMFLNTVLGGKPKNDEACCSIADAVMSMKLCEILKNAQSPALN